MMAASKTEDYQLLGEVLDQGLKELGYSREDLSVELFASSKQHVLDLYCSKGKNCSYPSPTYTAGHNTVTTLHHTAPLYAQLCAPGNLTDPLSLFCLSHQLEFFFSIFFSGPLRQERKT